MKRNASNLLLPIKRIRTVPVAYTLKFHKGNEEDKTNDEFEPAVNISLPSSTEIALLEWRSNFPCDKLGNKFPPIVFSHQLDTSDISPLIRSREIESLKSSGKIRTFVLGSHIAVIFTEDLESCVLNHLNPDKKVINFVTKVLPLIKQNEIEKAELKNTYKLTDSDISSLIRFGLLIIRNVNTYALSFPGMGEFKKLLYTGRKSILKSIAMSKYKELLVNEIESRSFEKTVKLGIKYQVADLVGARLVEKVETTSGTLLRQASTNS